jgi:predicted outer membrane repeat protein
LVPSEYATIQAAIDSADDGDMILVADGTYTGAGNKELTWDGTEKHITIKSANGPENCIIDLEDSGRAFTFVSGLGDNSIWITAADVIDGFTIRNGNTNDYAGAIYCYYGYENDVSPTIRNCVFENNTSNYGGAICIDGGSSLITNCVFDSNSANYGGAIYLGSAGGDTEPLIQQCTFTGNSADLAWNGQGGAIYLTNISTNEDCRINNNTFDGNSAPNGGAIYFSTSSPEVSGNLFVNNTGSTNGSALYIGNYEGPTISNCTIANNTGPEAVYCYGFNGTVEPVFINTIIWDSDSSFGFQDTSQANPIISYCNLESGFPTTGTDGGGNISIDPLFCSPDSGDYTLAENSSCVAAGTNGSNVGAFGVGCGSIHIGPLWYVATTGSDETGNGTDTNPFATIQTAIDSSIDGDTVLVAAGTYVENIDFNGKNIVITSTHGADSTIIDGNQLGRVVTFNGGEDSTAYLIGFTIQNGLITTANSDGGGIYISHSSPTLENLKVINNTSDDDGGGISCHIASDVASYPTLRNILVANNTSADDGGGIHVVASHPDLYNVTIVNNISGDDGGGINIASSQGNPSNVNILNSIIRDNSSNWHNTNSNLNITYSNIGYGYEGTGNIDANPLFCNPSGGDFSLGENSPCVGTGDNGANMGAFGIGCGIINQVFNVPADYGTVQAGIDATIDGDTVLVAAGTYVENINFNGKNIVVTSSQGTDSTYIDGNQDGSVVTFENGENSTAILSGFTITNGNGSGIEGYEGRGGGVFCINSSPTLKDLTVNGNQAETSGAGLWFGYSNSQLVDLIISNNVAAGDLGAGGGISINYNSDLTLTNMLVIGNEAAYGAGIELWSYSKPLLNSVTIVGNTGSYGGGLLLSGGCHPTINNSILWGNSPHEIQIGISEQPDSVSISYSDISGGQDSILTNVNGEIIWGLGNIDANPLFCDPDSGDYTLAENSPCIGTGYFGVNMGAFDMGCGPYNFFPTVFSLSEPSNNTQLTIDESNMNDGYITFSWGESSDANGDSLYYLMHAASAEIGDHGMDTNATSITVSYVDIIEDMSENNVTAATLEWTVHVTDDIDTVEADNAPFSITIDGANALRTYLEGLLPDEFALHQNYPNPFNPITTLRYDLPENGHVNVTIYDMLGRQVKTLISKTQDAGYKSVIWNATNDYGKPVSAGIYLYQIQAGEYISTKKMVLLK